MPPSLSPKSSLSKVLSQLCRHLNSEASSKFVQQPNDWHVMTRIATEARHCTAPTGLRHPAESSWEHLQRRGTAHGARAAGSWGQGEGSLDPQRHPCSAVGPGPGWVGVLRRIPTLPAQQQWWVGEWGVAGATHGKALYTRDDAKDSSDSSAVGFWCVLITVILCNSSFCLHL